MHELPGQFGELVKRAPMTMQRRESNSFYRSVSADRWDPAEQTISRHLTRDRALVELQHKPMGGHQVQVLWIWQRWRYSQLVFRELQCLQSAQSCLAFCIDHGDRHRKRSRRTQSQKMVARKHTEFACTNE